MKQTIDVDHFNYTDPEGCQAVCQLRVWEEPGRPAVAIATELDTNPGCSVTHSASVLWKQVWQYLERPNSGLVAIESYIRRSERLSPESRQTFDLVTFAGKGRFEGPTWRRLHRVEVELLLGGAVV